MSSGCADVEPLYSAWIDGELDAAESARVHAHLQDCAACCADVESVKRTRMLLRSLPVRRNPAGAEVPPVAGAGGQVLARSASPVTGSPSSRRRQRMATGVAVVGALLGGAVFALGAQPSPEDRVVTVPVDLFVADHLVHTVGGPMPAPVVVEGRR